MRLFAVYFASWARYKNEMEKLCSVFIEFANSNGNVRNDSKCCCSVSSIILDQNLTKRMRSALALGLILIAKIDRGFVEIHNVLRIYAKNWMNVRMCVRAGYVFIQFVPVSSRLHSCFQRLQHILCDCMCALCALTENFDANDCEIKPIIID